MQLALRHQDSWPGSQALEETTENMRRIGFGLAITVSMEVSRPQFFCTMGNESVERGKTACLHVGREFWARARANNPPRGDGAAQR